MKLKHLEQAAWWFANPLYELRKKAGYTPRQVAALAGLCWTTVYHNEKGYAKPNSYTMRKLSELYGVDQIDLEGSMLRWESMRPKSVRPGKKAVAGTESDPRAARKYDAPRVRGGYGSGAANSLPSRTRRYREVAARYLEQAGRVPRRRPFGHQA